MARSRGGAVQGCNGHAGRARLGPGLVTLTVLAPAWLEMAQVKAGRALKPAASVAVTVTGRSRPPSACR